jgi:hypothetical protein
MYRAIDPILWNSAAPQLLLPRVHCFPNPPTFPCNRDRRIDHTRRHHHHRRHHITDCRSSSSSSSRTTLPSIVSVAPIPRRIMVGAPVRCERRRHHARDKPTRRRDWPVHPPRRPTMRRTETMVPIEIMPLPRRLYNRDNDLLIIMRKIIRINTAMANTVIGPCRRNRPFPTCRPHK